VQSPAARLATGRGTAVAPPAGSSAAGAAFSPSEGFLALQWTSDEAGGPTARLEITSPPSGRLTSVLGTSIGSDTVVDFGWPTSGDSLVAEFIFPANVQLASWHPGATGLAVAVIRPGQDQASLVAQYRRGGPAGERVLARGAEGRVRSR
jgi:hypothetical protein